MNEREPYCPADLDSRGRNSSSNAVCIKPDPKTPLILLPDAKWYCRSRVLLVVPRSLTSVMPWHPPVTLTWGQSRRMRRGHLDLQAFVSERPPATG